MSQAPDYIPRNIEDFNFFQSNLTARVTAGPAAWNVPPTMVTELGTWSTEFAPLHTAMSNDDTRNKAQKTGYEVYRKNYEVFLRQLCQGFLTNNSMIPIEDRVAMKLNPRGLRPRTPRVKISTPPVLSIRPMTGGEVYFGFKIEGSNKVSARHPQSNGVEVFYKIVANGAPTPPPPTPPTSSVNETDPAPSGDASNAAEGLPSNNGFTAITHSRARFTRQMGLDNIGKILHVYARWVNTSNSALSSTYSMVATVVIS